MREHPAADDFGYDRICFDHLEGPSDAADSDAEAADSVSSCARWPSEARSDRSELSGLSVATPSPSADRDGTGSSDNRFFGLGVPSADVGTAKDSARTDDSALSGLDPDPGL